MAKTTTRLAIPYAELTDSNNLAYVSQVLAERVDTFGWPAASNLSTATLNTSGGWTINAQLVRVGPKTGIVNFQYNRTSTDFVATAGTLYSLGTQGLDDVFTGWADIISIGGGPVTLYVPSVVAAGGANMTVHTYIASGANIVQLRTQVNWTFTTTQIIHVVGIPVIIAGE